MQYCVALPSPRRVPFSLLFPAIVGLAPAGPQRLGDIRETVPGPGPR
jgi:hypothetical protein